MFKKNLPRAGAVTFVLVALMLAVPSSRRALAGSFTAITEYAVRFIQVTPSALPTNCAGNDCIYVSNVDDKAYHRNTSGTAVSLEGGGGSVSITCGTGLSCSPSTITGTGTITNTGGVSWPLENGTSTNALLYGGSMTGSSIAESHNSTNAYTTGDVAYENKSAGTRDWYIGYPASATIPEFRGVGNNLGFRNVNGDGVVMQAANHVYIYGAGAQMIDFVANNGIANVSGFPLYIGTVAAPFQYAAFDWYAAPAGTALASATTITPTTGYHSLTGTTPVATIATTNLPTSFTGFLTLTCTAACAFTNAGNILVPATGLTGVAGQQYTFFFNGTNWAPPGLPAGSVVSSTMTSGVLAGATGANSLANSTFKYSSGTLDLVSSGVMTFGGSNTTSVNVTKSLSQTTQTVSGTTSTTIPITGGAVVELTLVTATPVTTVTMGAGVDGQEIEIQIVQPASGTAAAVSGWTNTSFAGSSFTNTATLGKRDVIGLRYRTLTSKWYERYRSLNESN